MSALPPPFDALWFRMSIGFLIGAALGSFGTMLAYRVPRKLSIVSPRSHCTCCNTILSIRELVPIASYITGDGKCRHCGAVIGRQYLYIELVSSFAGALISGFLF